MTGSSHDRSPFTQPQHGQHGVKPNERKGYGGAQNSTCTAHKAVNLQSMAVVMEKSILRNALGTTCREFRIRRDHTPNRIRLLARRKWAFKHPNVLEEQVVGAAAVDIGPKSSLDVAVPSPEEVRQTTRETFLWESQWYPIAYEEDLNGKWPQPVQLLGKDLVLWRDGKGAWHCFEDRCPHRLAPLSEGRVDESTGQLMCSYHGWEFRGDGSCARIPQAVDPPTAAAATSSPRSCVAVHPLQVKQGLIWVWGSSDPASRLEAEEKPIPTVPQLDAQDRWRPHPLFGDRAFFIIKGYMRDVPYSWETLAENLLDPAHINFAHHSVIGNRNMPTSGSVVVRPLPANTGPSIPLVTSPGFQLVYSQSSMFLNGIVNKTVLTFDPPTRIQWYVPNTENHVERDVAAGMGSLQHAEALASVAQEAGPNVGRQVLSFYMTPTAPGKARAFVEICFMVKGKSPIPWIAQLIFGAQPRWLTHLDGP
eukprot:jgi/Botrbrau1/4640/Bobra.33_2s0011.1